MPRPYLGETAYGVFCQTLGTPQPEWDALPMQERIAWSVGVYAAVKAAHAVPCQISAEPPSPQDTQPDEPVSHQAWTLRQQGLSREEISTELHVSCRTVSRYLSRERQAARAALSLPQAS